MLGTILAVGLVIAVTGWSLWWWNELWYVVPLKGRCTKLGAKLPPGHMGLPFLGEKLAFFWYFNILRCPDEFINSSSAKFILEWPTREVLGPHSISSLHGDHHKRIKSFISNALNSPESIRRIVLLVQPHIATAFQSWAQKGKVKTFYEMKKVAFLYLGKYIASFEAGPELDTLEQLILGLSKGHRAHPRKMPATTYYHALQCRKRVIQIFLAELEKRRRDGNNKNDIMDQLMQMKDGQGEYLSDEEVIDNLRDENVKMSMEKRGEYITREDISKLKYTNKVVDETLRMSGISGFFFWTATDDINLD
ncbi:hypothetical protein Ancab_022817, partial [Ancistrocladus abbreviatus]